MKFMSMVRGSHANEGMPPDPKLMAAIGALAEKYFQKGVMVSMGGLAPSSSGTMVRATGGKLVVQDGPFAEVKEVIGGFAIMECESQAEAVELAREFLQIHIDILGPSYEGACEVRQLFG